MTAEPPENPLTEAIRSLEVRWIFPGQLEDAVAGWFAGFPAAVESREDTYLLDPHARPGLVDPGLRGDRPSRSAPQRIAGHRGARVRPAPARWRGTRPG